MYVPMRKPLDVRDMRLMLATAGATAALLALLTPAEPFALRIAAAMGGGLLATLLYGRISRIAIGSRVALNLAGVIPLAALAFGLTAMDWGGASLAARAAAAFVTGFTLFGAIIIGDRLRTILRENS